MDLLKIPYKHLFAIEWKMKKADLEALKFSTKDGIFSQKDHNYYASKIAGVYYNFCILPYGENDIPKGRTWIYLHLSLGKIKEVKAKYVISIESANVSNNVEQIFKAPTARGTMICESDELFDPENNYFVKDEILIKIDGTLMFDRPLVSKLAYPISTKWTFKASDLEQLREEIGRCVESKTFEIPFNSGIKYNLQIFPNGPNEELEQNFFIAFYAKFESDEKIEAYLTFIINSGLCSKISYQLIESSKTYGYSLCSTEEFFDPKNRYLVHEEMTVNINGNFMVEKKDPEFLLYFDAIETGTLETTEYNERNFIIVVDGQEIQVNKQLLANVSTVFAGMMQSGMKETIENRIEIPEFPFKTVDSAIKLLYGILLTFILEDMLPLLVFSDKYDIQIIKDLVEDHLISELAPSNVCQLIHFSNLFNATKLYEKSAEYFLKCYKESVGVNDLDLLEKEMLLKIFVSALPSISY